MTTPPLRLGLALFLPNVSFGPVGPSERGIKEVENVWTNTCEDVAFGILFLHHSLDVVPAEATADLFYDILKRLTIEDELVVDVNGKELFDTATYQAYARPHLAVVEYLQVIVVAVEVEQT